MRSRLGRAYFIHDSANRAWINRFRCEKRRRIIQTEEAVVVAEFEVVATDLVGEFQPGVGDAEGIGDDQAVQTRRQHAFTGGDLVEHLDGIVKDVDDDAGVQSVGQSAHLWIVTILIMRHEPQTVTFGNALQLRPEPVDQQARIAEAIELKPLDQAGTVTTAQGMVVEATRTRREFSDKPGSPDVDTAMEESLLEPMQQAADGHQVALPFFRIDHGTTGEAFADQRRKRVSEVGLRAGPV